MDGFLDGLFNTGKGIFDRIADLELGKLELQLASEQRAGAAQAQAAAAPAPGSFAMPSGFNIDGKTVLIGAGILVGGVVLFRLLK